MRTITFYSYKGGVGRSLLVANAAKYLSTLGKSVLALDLDLEAPGLHYKFELGVEANRSEAAPGVVDILFDFLSKKELPSSLKRYLTEVRVPDGAGRIQIMRAGMAPYGDYWNKLSKVNWYDILYGREPVGAPFFLELKERIRAEAAPDFLLIDARTGITEMGGIATTLLPDTVVCLALASQEHLEGLRAVMQGINQTTGRDGSPVQLLAVISRLPFRREEGGELTNILAFLRTPIKASTPIRLDEVFALHSEPLLDVEEQLLIGGSNSPHELPLLRDYLRLFSKIIPAEEIRPYVGKLVQQAVSRLLDDPDGAQSDLEALTAYCADEEAYRALLRLYLVRKASPDKVLATASLMWQLRDTNAKVDQVLKDIVLNIFDEVRIADIQKKYAEFAEAIWRLTDKDIRVCMTIVAAYLPQRRERAVRLLTEYIEEADNPAPIAVVRLLDLLRPDEGNKALQLVDRFKSSVLAPEFHVSWARAVIRQMDVSAARKMLNDPAFRSDALRTLDPVTMYHLLKLTDDDSAGDYLRIALEGAVAADNVDQMRVLSAIFVDEGDVEELEAILRARLSRNVTREIVAMAQKRARRGSRLLLEGRERY